jgi:hypothetical protein
VSADAYLDAKAAFDRANTKINELSHKVGRVAAALLHQRDTFTFSNVEGPGFPPEAIMSRSSVSEDGNTWPSAKTINQALAEWHQARQAMNSAWSAVPADRRAGLVPPAGTHG